jgi:hypothetical protein
MWNVLHSFYMHKGISSFTGVWGKFVLSAVCENWQQKSIVEKNKITSIGLIFHYDISSISVYGWPKCGQQMDKFVGGYCEG